MTFPPLLHTNCCKQIQEDEEIRNDIDFSSIKPKLKSLRHEALPNRTGENNRKLPGLQIGYGLIDG
jgi:hypothetical protein